MQGANLQSLQVLIDFRETLPVIISMAESEMQEMLHHVDRAIHDSEKDLDSAYAALESIERRLRRADEPSDRLYDAVWAAREKVAQAQSRHTDIQAAGQTFAKVVDAARSRLNRVSSAGQHYLDERIKTAQTYLALSAIDSGLGSPMSRGSSINQESTVSAQSRGTPGKSSISFSKRIPALAVAERNELPDLPRGFEWVSVDDIDWTEAPEELDYKKVSKDKITTMLTIFEVDLLPILSKNPNITRDELFEMDKQLGRMNSIDGVRSDSLVLCHECMIGSVRESDLIVMDIYPSDDGKQFGFTSGRHRSRAAKDLGWKYIPAQVRGRLRS